MKGRAAKGLLRSFKNRESLIGFGIIGYALAAEPDRWSVAAGAVGGALVVLGSLSQLIEKLDTETRALLRTMSVVAPERKEKAPWN